MIGLYYKGFPLSYYLIQIKPLKAKFIGRARFDYLLTKPNDVLADMDDLLRIVY